MTMQWVIEGLQLVATMALFYESVKALILVSSLASYLASNKFWGPFQPHPPECPTQSSLHPFLSHPCKNSFIFIVCKGV